MDIGSFKSGLPGRRFIEELASLLEPWGMARSVGRVYGYLMLSPQPVGLEEIAAELALSKSGAWKAAQELESFGHVRRFSAPGSKRALYSQSEDFAAPLRSQMLLLRAMAKILEDCASSIESEETATQLHRRADFYVAMSEAIEAAIEELAARSSRERAGVRHTASAEGHRGQNRRPAGRE